MSDDLNKRQLRCRQQYSIATRRFRELMEKFEAIEPPQPQKKKKKRSEKKPEAEKSSKPTTEEERAAYKDIAETVRECLKELGDDVDDQEDIAGPSGPSAAPGDN